DSHKIMKVMEEDNTMSILFPEFPGTNVSIKQGIECCRRIEGLLGNPEPDFPNQGQNISANFTPPSRVTCLKLAALFSGEPIAQKAALRLKMSKKEASLVTRISIGYKNIISLFSEAAEKPELLRYLQCTQDNIYPVAFLAASLDHTGSVLPFFNKLMSLYIDEIIPRMGRLRMITGDDLISEFGLSPSPDFRRILSELQDDILLGKVSTKEEAFKAVKEILKDRKDKGHSA